MSTEMIVVLCGAFVVAVAAIATLLRRRKATDGVDSFRRQIDALSPEARRGVVDRVQNVTERDPEEGDHRGA